MIPRYKLRLLIESILLESVKREQRYLIEKYPQYAAKLSGMQNKWIGWLADRFGTNPTREETASFDEAIKAVEGYPQGAADKYNTNEYFRKLIDAEFPAGDRSWSNLADPTLMTVAEMLKISELNKKKKPRIEVDRTQRVDQYEIARVGPWKISEAPDRESSCNIIGLKPGTDKPRADVCIARTDASNLFYKYAADYTIFMVMRGDNPTEKEILIFGYKDDGTPEFHANPRQNPTVDGNNDALTPAIVERTLGEHHDSIMSIMRNHVLSRTGPSPARQKINSAARNIADYNDVLRGISQAEAFSLKQAIASRSEISQEVANRLLAETDEEILKTLASNTGISRETMMQLAQNPNNNVRNAIIQNPSVSREALDFIARNDPEPVILQQVARSSLASPETLADLMRNPDEGVQVWAAYNLRTPIEALRRAARRGSSDVRRSVAQNKSADEEILRYLADDPDEQVRDAVIMNPNAPADLIQQVKSGGTMASLRQLIRRMM